MNYLKPTEIEGMKEKYVNYPGPYAISEPDLNKIFPGILEVKTTEYGAWCQGNLLEFNLKFINMLMAYLKPKIAIEIGTFKGRTTYNMAKNSPLSRVITVDPGPNVSYYQGNDKQYLQKKSDVGIIFKKTEVESHITQILEDSTSPECEKELDKILGGKKINFAFIDGGHSYRNIKHDFEELILPRLAKDGVVVFDDYGRLFTVVDSVGYLNQKAREDGFIFYWYAPRESPNTNEVLYLNGGKK